MYAAKITDSMRAAIDETKRRGTIQAACNSEHGIVPRTTSAKLTPLEQEKQAPGSARGRGGKKSGPTDIPVGLDRARDEDLLPNEIAERIRELEARALACA